MKVLLKDPRIDEDKYLLCLASRFGNQEVVEALLDQPNIDVNIVGIKIFCGNAVTFMFLTIQSIIQTRPIDLICVSVHGFERMLHGLSTRLTMMDGRHSQLHLGTDMFRPRSFS